MARGKFIKGGIPNLEAAARIIIGDWSQGKIKYYSTPEGGYTTADATNLDMEIENFHNE